MRNLSILVLLDKIKIVLKNIRYKEMHCSTRWVNLKISLCDKFVLCLRWWFNFCVWIMQPTLQFTSYLHQRKWHNKIFMPSLTRVAFGGERGNLICSGMGLSTGNSADGKGHGYFTTTHYQVIIALFNGNFLLALTCYGFRGNYFQIT